MRHEKLAEVQDDDGADIQPLFFDVESTGLNPLAQEWHNGVSQDAQVTAVAVARMFNWREVEERSDLEIGTQVILEPDEYPLLEACRDRLRAKVDHVLDAGEEPVMVGYNNRVFDHPYLGARFARKRIDGSLWNHKLRRIDMMRVCGKSDRTPKYYNKEDDVVEMLGIETDDTLTGADMPEAFEAGDFDAIHEHVESDTVTLAKLFYEFREEALGEFYDHYDIDRDVDFSDEVVL